MLPISAKDVHRLQPDGEAGPTYLIKTPSFLERAAWRREVASAGARYPGDAALFQALKDDLKAVGPENLSELLARVDEVATMDREERTADVMQAITPVIDMVRRLGGDYARLEAERSHWVEIAPYVAAQRFLVGVEGGEVPVKPTQGGLDVATLAALPQDHVLACGWRAVDLMTLSRAAAKN